VLLSNISETAILSLDNIPVTGNLSLSALTSNSASINYSVEQNGIYVSNLRVELVNPYTGAIIQSIPLSSLSGTADFSNLLENNNYYRINLVAYEMNAVIDTISFVTPPNTIQDGTIHVNIMNRTVVNNEASVVVKLSGSEADLNAITNVSLNLSPNTTPVIISAETLASLKTGNATIINIPNLTPATNYRATINIDGITTDLNSNLFVDFTTLSSNDLNGIPSFNSAIFMQTQPNMSSVKST